jgi:hypothetical protein
MHRLLSLKLRFYKFLDLFLVVAKRVLIFDSFCSFFFYSPELRCPEVFRQLARGLAS